MFAGIDFPDAFSKDNFAQRRNNSASAGNAYDPESLITGAEVAAGFTYLNSKREWSLGGIYGPNFSEEVYNSAVSGMYTPDQIAARHPRVLLPSQVGEQRATRYHPDFDGAFDHIHSTSRLSTSYGDLRVASELDPE